MSDLTLNPGAVAAVPAGDKQLAVPQLPVGPTRRRDECRTRRRLSATRLAAADDGFRLFRVY